MMLTLAVTIGALIGIVAWQADAIWETIGFGAIPGASMVCAVVGTFLFRPRMIVVHWFRFLGLILLGFTSWGALAFYDAFEGTPLLASLYRFLLPSLSLLQSLLPLLQSEAGVGLL